MKLPSIHTEDKPVRIRISNTDFLVDEKMRVLRQVDDSRNTISFDKLKYSDEHGGYAITFDKLSKNIYTGYMPQNGIPPMTERIVIPRLSQVETNRLTKPDEKKQDITRQPVKQRVRRQTM